MSIQNDFFPFSGLYFGVSKDCILECLTSTVIHVVVVGVSSIFVILVVEHETYTKRWIVSLSTTWIVLTFSKIVEFLRYSH